MNRRILLIWITYVVSGDLLAEESTRAPQVQGIRIEEKLKELAWSNAQMIYNNLPDQEKQKTSPEDLYYKEIGSIMEMMQNSL